MVTYIDAPDHLFLNQLARQACKVFLNFITPSSYETPCLILLRPGAIHKSIADSLGTSRPAFDYLESVIFSSSHDQQVNFMTNSSTFYRVESHKEGRMRCDSRRHLWTLLPVTVCHSQGRRLVFSLLTSTLLALIKE